MGSKERRHSQRRLKNINHRDEPYFNKSKDYLRLLIYNGIKSVFVGALRAIETRLGKNFPSYPGLRAEILRIGNDAIREAHQYLEKFNVEYIPDKETFNFQGKGEVKGHDKEID
ncbi:MAG: hypothetical protein DRP85_00800 [Candidatus Makaraimicrobium thalassicum]|nr:MAG: hypothetical protein DRP85_00800 [Candidatus Omnitrophota bacterium]